MSFSKEYDCYSKVLNVRAATSGNVPIIDHRAAGTTICKEYGCYSKVLDVRAATSGNIHCKGSVSVGVKYWVLFNRLSSCRNNDLQRVRLL
ncbi:hypothetical protein LYZ41_05160 [Elizabethkingia miricola]|uniref:hypothetical protein n=2 Tax=Elizabethkingia miricola TaxID=172045 RepID=UPI00137489DD|nr:hypothetical protein [Elizabethkingia miricola]QHQ86217.1 hypothetical protein FE632_05250 [Elizabethkingia miricola]UIO97477.1 hypothetical protein LYZ41_05160 [Elizabethkingia miricola]WNG66185.1 hypothetical protein M9H57_05265 [Elizabethkingia miricola]